MGLDYYDRFEWLLRTPLRSGNDNLIVERKRAEKYTFEYSKDILPQIQYGDCVIVENLEKIADSETGFSSAMFELVATGVEVIDSTGKYLIESTQRETLMHVLFAQRMLAYRERLQKQNAGIEKAKKEGKYRGRKPLDVDLQLLEQVAKELDQKLITVPVAMKRLGLTSRSTFYRKLKQVKENVSRSRV